MINFGAVPIGAVLPVFFDSFAGSTGASVTITGLAVTDIEIYKGTSMTQRSSDAGYALIDTDGIDLDGITGIHGFSIDTGDNTDAGFYAAGSYYNVVVSAITVDSQTVSFLAATFRCVTAEGVAGQPKVDAAAFGGTAGTFSGGRPEVNTTHAAGTAWGSGAITAGAIADNAIDLATFATDAKALFGVIAFGTAQSVTGTTIQLASAETFADDELIGATVLIRSATTGAGQARVITDYVSATDTATVDTWTTTPTGTITYVVIATAPASTSAPIAANVTQFAGSAITSASGIPEVKVASIANNAITAAAIATNAIDADALATDAVTEIQSGLSTLTQANIRTAVGLASANLDTQLTAIDDFIDTEVASILAAVDTEVAAIKAKTDSLTFTVAGQVDANIQSVNDVTVNGNGAGTPWGP